MVQKTERDVLASPVTVITAEQIEALQAQDLPAALRRTPGIVVSRHNPVGSFGGGEGGSVTMRMREDRDGLAVEVEDTGVGLPPDRDRIVEPYMTTRARGTGLGLAIVKKIVEEHHGTMTFADRDGGGTVVRMVFDTAALAKLDQGAATPEPAGEGRLAALTPNRT